MSVCLRFGLCVLVPCPCGCVLLSSHGAHANGCTVWISSMTRGCLPENLAQTGKEVTKGHGCACMCVCVCKGGDGGFRIGLRVTPAVRFLLKFQLSFV